MELGLVEPQPHERVRRGRQRLHRPGALADHRDQLGTGIQVTAACPQQLRGPGTGGHPQRHQCPVTVRPQRSEQLVELLVRDAPRRPPGEPGPVKPGALAARRIHRAAVRPRPPATSLPRQRERVDHRPLPGLDVQVIESPQHALAMGRSCRRVGRAGRRLPGHPVRPRCRRAGSSLPYRRPAGALAPADALRLAAGLHPAGVVTRFGPGGLIPRHPDRPKKTGTTATGRSPIRPLCRLRPPERLQFRQEPGHRPDLSARRINETVRPPRRARLLQPPDPGHHQGEQVTL
jgi:hypothetical protein